MNALSAEWVEKAESDYRAAEREMRVRKEPSYDVVCFHAQQCAEKYLKAALLEHQLPFRRIHDLEVLLDILVPINLTGKPSAPRCCYLTTIRWTFAIPGKRRPKTRHGLRWERCEQSEIMRARILGFRRLLVATSLDCRQLV